MPTTCGRCGTANPGGFQFCGTCGAALEADVPEAREVRKTVTVLFCDVAGSTGLAERLDPEVLRRALRRYFDEMRLILERHGGHVEKFIGDAVVGVFGVPISHEDDALRGVRAAAEMRARVASLDVELEHDHGIGLGVRIGLNTGPVVAGSAQGGGALVTGDAVNVAARLQQMAEPGEILLGAETVRLVRDAVRVEATTPVAVRGRSASVGAARLLSIDPEAVGHVRRMDAPLVARDRELQRLRDAFEDAVGERACVLFTVLGAAGVGKSRLVHEFLAGIRDRATVLRGRCLPYGEGITWWPVAETVRAAAGIRDADDAAQARERIATALGGRDAGGGATARVAAMLGLGDSSGTADETMWAVRRLYERVASEKPLVVVFDDIHWGEPTFLDFIESVADWSRDVPILLLCIARPELLEERPAWGGGKLRARTVLLEPLSATAVERLIEHLVRGVLEPSAVVRIGQAAEGNPLYVEEFLEMLVDDGLLAQDGERWVARGDLTSVPVPPTVAALLASRLDRLRPPERAVVDRASVVGKVFWRGAVAALAPEPLQADVGRHLLALVRKELVRPDAESGLADDAYRFRHLLVRDAAYDAVPKDERSDLHVRFAGWLERTVADRVGEYEELLGYHLEQAYRYRVEVGRRGSDTDAIGRRGAAHLAHGGRRAMLLGDVQAAASLLGRAAALLPSADLERVAILSDLVEALADSGRFADVQTVADEVVARAADRPELEAFGWRARVQSRLTSLLADDTPWEFVDVIPLLDAATAASERLADEPGLARVWLVRGQGYSHTGRLQEAADSYRKAVEHAQRASDTGRVVEATALLASTEFYGMTPIQQAGRTIEELRALATSAGSRFEEARAHGHMGRIAAMQGRFDEGRRLTRMGIATMSELGRRVYEGGSRHWSGYVEVCAENWAAAEAEYRRSAEILDTIGERSYLSTSLSEQAFALAKLGRSGEARTLAERARSYGAPDDAATQIVLRMALALASLREGDIPAADSMVRQALSLADRAEYSAERFRCRILAAEVFAAAGAVDEARARVAEALGIADLRGATAWHATATRIAGEIEGNATPTG
jgi:class 3 adenylate cyclase/tetratricopeptide (TPR) repeat protein